MPSSQWSSLLKPLRPLVYLASVALVVGVLSAAQALIVPIAIAAMLSFILSAPVALLERKGLGRIPAVALVVLLSLGFVGAFAYVLTQQFTDFAGRMPRYSASIKEKLATIRATQKSAIAGIEETVSRLSHELDVQELEASRRQAKADPMGPPEPPQPPQRVIVLPTDPTDLERLRSILEPVFIPITRAGIVLILLIFMLIQREDLRNRFIRLIGPAKITLTTRTMDEAGHRISRFLFSQSVINLGFGACVTVGLAVIGIPYAILWGVTAALLRFVPYLGSALGLLLPLSLAFVQSPGWTPALATLALFITLDIVTAYVIEPILIGTHTGVSSLALLVSALFWTWLWGPVGLLLSTPLTVCLAVLGKHVNEVSFLAVLLSDEAPLETEISFYQRLLAGDDDEAERIVDKQIAASSRQKVFDGVIVPTLLMAARDRLQDEIADSEYQFVLSACTQVVRDPVAPAIAGPGDDAVTAPAERRTRVLAVAARNAADEMAIEMLAQSLDSTCTVEQITTTSLASEVLLAIEKEMPDVLCISSLPPGGLAHARYIAKRVRGRFPEMRIWVLRPGAADPTALTRHLAGDGVDSVATSFADARAQLEHLALLPHGVAHLTAETLMSTAHVA